ncbi:alpha/beta fold hydrolase [Bacillus xiapuensis]|uniref:alpha/beta fold hydrolase n=1 Tax=Bacillus xiapuensis TaxID=2014075 RepID=UPI000C244272|nr:alpha/beta hydrolase [Bacillus xiapuensis]
MSYAEIHNRRIYYETAGEGPVVIFVHPPGMSGLVFCKQLPLSEQCKLVVIDLNGHGNSSPSISGDPNSFLEDIFAVQTAVQEEQVFLFGYSAGGTVVQQYALRYPERVKGVILASGYPKAGPLLFKIEHAMAIQLAEKTPALMAKLISRSHFHQSDDRERMYQSMMKANPTIWQSYYRFSLTFDCTGQLSEWRLPLLLLYGEKAPIIKRHWAYYQAVPKKQMVFFKEGTHQLPSKSPADIHPVVADFIQRWR